MVLTLYKMEASGPVRAVLMTIEALHLPDVQMVEVDVMKGAHLNEDYLKLNPQHSVPVLKDDDFVIWDSHAIAAYLVTKYGADDSLYPTDPQQRAVVDQRLHFDSGILFPAYRGTIDPVYLAGEKDFLPEAVEKTKKAYQFTDNFLAGSDWLAGERVTLADICAAASISSLNALVEIDAVAYPNLAAWFDRISQQDFYKKGNKPGLDMLIAGVKTMLPSKF